MAGMTREKFSVDCDANVEIYVSEEAPPDAITRALTEEWQSHMYTFDDLDEVLERLAYNCLFNGVEDASRLDGWGDLDKGMVTMRASR